MKRFPLGLTITAAIAFSILIALGMWQLHRLTWKTHLLDEVAALRDAPAHPIDQVLAAYPAAGAAEYHRVSATCAAPRVWPRDAYRYALRDGAVAWRLVSACRLEDGPYDGVLLDRGVVSAFNGQMSPGVARFLASAQVIGVLRAPGGKPLLGPGETGAEAGVRVIRVLDDGALSRVARDNGLTHPAPYLLAVESETPATAGVAPAALPQDIPNNHFVYALTWFALAAALAWVYGAMLVQRLRRP